MENPVIDLHIHSHHSKDSISKPKDIIKMAKKHGLTCIAITDHNSIMGGIEAQRLVKNDPDMTIIIGSEIKTNCGDIIGLFLNTNIESYDYKSVIKEIKSQGGLTILPHPYRDHTHLREVAPLVDAIEVWNSRSHFHSNVKASLLAEEFNKKITHGSDAHTLSEIGNVKVEVHSTRDLWEADTIMKPISLKGSRSIDVGKSIVIKRLRKRQFVKLFRDGANFLFKRHF